MPASAPPPSPSALLGILESLPLPAAAPPPGPSSAPGGAGEAFAWHLRRKGQGLAVDVLACQEGPGGWRTGARVPYPELPCPGGAAWSRLGPRERAAFTALAAFHKRPSGLPFALLGALEGHGRLSWAEDLGSTPFRVALLRERSALEVRRRPEGLELRLSIRPRPGETVRLDLQGDRLAFTGFTPLHHRLEALLGAGLLVPAAQGPRLARILARLSSHLSLLTDLAPDPEPPRTPPERSLCVWARGGGARLDLQLRSAAPRGLSRELPGQGCAFWVSGAGGARAMGSRDLLLERRRLDQFRALLPPSAQPLGAPLSWRIEGPLETAALLSALRDLGPAFRLEGVPGLAPALPERAGLQDLERRPGGAPGETLLSGTLGGIPLGTLLPALQEGGRFLQVAPGRQLDLAALGLPALRGLAAWARPAGPDLRLPPEAQPFLRPLLGEAEPPPAPLPSGFQGQLRPYQMEGFQWMAGLLADGLGACLADDMGLGKTVQTAALLLHRAPLGPALVLAPTSLTLNWLAELRRFAPELRVIRLASGDRGAALGPLGPGQVVLASHGLLLSESRPLEGVPWATAVLDEAQAIKNPRTRRAKACRRLEARGRLALTGTPVENRPEELASLLAWLLPSGAGPIGSAAPEALRDLAAPFLLRRRKSEVLKELPPRLERTLRVELGPEETACHQALLERCRAEAADRGMASLLAALMKLRRACAHPRLADPDYRGPAAKVDRLLRELETLTQEGHRSLVFSQFTDLLDLVQARLRARGIPFLRLDGTLSAGARQRAVTAFQKGEAPVFLLSLRAGGTGLNLTAADEVFHLDPWWNPAVEDQASDRAHRMGQTRPVTLHRMVAAGTVEEQVLALHGDKRRMVEELLEGRSRPLSLDRAALEALLGA